MRTCIGCRRKAPVSSLVRVTTGPASTLVVGGPGRGAWLCRGSERCVDLAERRQSFGRALGTQVAPAAVAGLRVLLDEVVSSREALVPGETLGPGAVCEDGELAP